MKFQPVFMDPVFHVYVSKWWMRTAVFKIGPLLSESTAAGNCETGDSIVERIPTETDLFVK